jgi:hypothetical protein
MDKASPFEATPFFCATEMMKLERAAVECPTAH